MSRPKSDRPAYCRHKRTNRGYVTIDGRQHTLPGAYGSEESRAAHERLVGTWMANGRTLPDAALATVEGAAPAAATSTSLTITELIAAFWRHAQAYYRIDGTSTGEAENFKSALRPLRRQYGETPAEDFGPLALQALRASMLLPQAVVDAKTGQPVIGEDGKPVMRPGWSRNHANAQVKRIKRMFKWAVARELIPPSVFHAIKEVEAIKRWRGARETAPVKPVALSLVEPVLDHVAPEVAAMIRLQLLTGMRPGEAVLMRGVDLDTSGSVWVYTPPAHKTALHGHERTIFLGPRAQDVIRPFLKSDLSGYLFSPADAERARRDALHAARKTPLSCGNRPGTNRSGKPARKPGAHYTTVSYYKAIVAGCDKAFAPPDALGRLRLPARRGKIRTRWETITEWRRRLGAEQWAELRRWQKDHRWHPHQLRHNAGTQYRRDADFEVAKTVLGHRSDSMVTRYAERDAERAKDAVARLG